MKIQALSIVVLLLLSAGSIEAQQLAGTFDQLQVLVKAGDTLTVTDESGRRVRGKLTELSKSTLVLDASGVPSPFQESSVASIEKRGSDSLKDGALIGLAVGGGLGAAVMAAYLVDNGEVAFAAIGALMYGGIGAGIGVGFDALIEGQQVIYARSSFSRATVNVAPIVTGRRKGVLLSVGWGR